MSERQSAWTCPTCRGSFPGDALDDDACPWCGQQLGNAKQQQQQVVEHIAQREEEQQNIRSAARRLIE